MLKGYCPVNNEKNWLKPWIEVTSVMKSTLRFTTLRVSEAEYSYYTTSFLIDLFTPFIELGVIARDSTNSFILR
jgi:hypothetical protein